VNKRDKLRTQGDMLEDTSAAFFSNEIVNGTSTAKKDTSQGLHDSQKINGLAPNLSDVEAMMRFHVGN
jgi:hypothetical protein